MVFCIVFFSVILGASARSFRRSSTEFLDTVSEEELRSTLLAEIEASYGPVSQRGRFSRLEAALEPVWKSLPKNEHGRLGHTTVRYALHRIFVQRHGWYIKGLEPAGQHFNSSTPTGILKDHVGSHVEELFESRLGGKGFDLHDTAVLAATLEHLIIKEAEGRLSKSYVMTNIPRSKALDAIEAERVLDAYMKLYLMSDSLDSLAIELSDEEMTELFTGWTGTKEFTRDVFKELTRNGEIADFHRMTAVVGEISERFGQFQNGQCKTIKSKLMKLGDRNIGRVPLQDFYRTSTMEFEESPAYLRQLGVLDDDDQVIVPNYVGSQPNCLDSSSLYSVCCIDECEQLLGKLEREIAAPEATPNAIIGLISGMSSSTVEAPRNLPTKLVDRLEEAAAQHAGTVQLHGRLFAQWMHHAFPWECPFPHVSGSITPQTPDEWLESQGNDVYATEEEILHYTSKVVEKKTQQSDFEHWIEHEELLVPVAPRRSSSKISILVFMLFTVILIGASIRSVPLELLGALYGSESKGSTLPVFSGKAHML